MKLYAYTTPEIAKHAGFLKIGETNGCVAERVNQQGRELDIEKNIVWQDAVITERTGIDKRLRRFLKEQGFQVRQFGTGHDTEWVKCTVGDIEKAFEIVKRQIYDEEKQREEVGNQFYLEIRNWFYWTTQDNHSIDADYALRLVIRLLFCFFLREKDELVPKELLDQSIEKLLKSDEEYSYYNGILRNLFFRSINTQGERKYESEKLFVDKKRIKDWFSKIPFLNGGLFDEHDKDDISIGNDYFFSQKKTRLLTELDDTYDVYGIITILSKYQYKLTLDDLLDQAEYGKTVDPEFIGKVFESLLACIDTDSKTTRRKITGSYYTPREIVDYMVNEALESYLQDHDDLLQCKILDPACGSGAFPCGIMNEIMRRLDPHRTLSTLERYRKKLKIVQEVIYGVDIQPMAVQITLLRFFLSLIQDITPDKQKENYGIDPLPNLEIKFVCADTLIGLEKKDKNGQGKLELPIIKETVKQLRETRSQYFVASSVQEKERLRKYDETLRKTLGIAMEDAGALTHGVAEKVVAWNPYDQFHSSPFFDSMWMFGIDKFDIVIGNPPYGVKYPATHKEYFKQQYLSAMTSDITINGCTVGKLKGSLDTFSLFIENGFNRLKQNGFLAFIVPITVVSSDSMTALHNLLEKHCSVIKFASLSDRPQQIFQHSHQKTTIIGFRKDNQRNKRVFSTQMYRKDKETSLESIIKKFKFIDVTGLGLNGRYAKISLPIEKRILKKLLKIKTTIGTLKGDTGKAIYYRVGGGEYYKTVTNYSTGSTKEKALFFEKKYADCIGAILSTSLVWWYNQVYTRYPDWKAYEIESFPIPVDALTAPVRRKIEKLYEQYLQDIERHVIERETTEYKHVTIFKEYKIRYSKSLIDAMDDIICPLYGLTNEELGFIKNYELRFRIDG